MSSQPPQTENLGSHASLLEDALARIELERVTERIWAKDASLWKTEDAHQKIIRNSLGWLTVAQLMAERTAELEEFAKEVHAAGFKYLMLLGMGGSSLCPEVLRRTFQTAGAPRLLVLDTTDPDTIASFERRIELEQTLFIVSSKSGSTIEPLSFYKYFHARVAESTGERAGENFVAITDPGTLMERMSREAGFRRIFLNPSDIGGRYSALSYFGMVPAALMGLDVGQLIKRALAAASLCGPSVETKRNVGARLGAVMGALALAGRDKLTLVTDGEISSLGLWIEQLIAESTGKEGKGIVPISGERLGAPDVYADDRIFVSVSVGEPDEAAQQKLSALEAAGHVVVRRTLQDAYDLGAEFFTWEMATAVAGALMQINPFDQPNVQESKDNTNQLLEEWKRTGSLPEQATLVADGGLKIYSAQSGFDASADAATGMTIESALKDFFELARSGDYIALLAYLQETDEHDELLEEIRTVVRDRLRIATTVGYGPRFLHSTGQLHKGGAANGLFIQLTDEDGLDLAIPGEPYSFSVLKQAQALGDFNSLASRQRRAIRFHTGSDATAGLRRLLEFVRADLRPTTGSHNRSRSAEN